MLATTKKLVNQFFEGNLPGDNFLGGAIFWGAILLWVIFRRIIFRGQFFGRYFSEHRFYVPKYI